MESVIAVINKNNIIEEMNSFLTLIQHKLIISFLRKRYCREMYGIGFKFNHLCRSIQSYLEDEKKDQVLISATCKIQGDWVRINIRLIDAINIGGMDLEFKTVDDVMISFQFYKKEGE